MTSEAVAIMRRTPAILEAMIAGFPGEHVNEAPAPGEWSAAQILAHLVEVEDLLSRRVESMIASDTVPAGSAVPPSPSESLMTLLQRWLDARDRTLERLDARRPTTCATAPSCGDGAT